MIGLVKKDALVMRKVIKSYISILAVMLLLSALGLYQLSFVTSFVSVMVMMLPISAFAYDEQAKWDGYAMALPLGHKAVVGGRYLFTLLLMLCIGAFGAACCTVQSIAFSENPMASFPALLSALSAAILIVDIMLPLNYKFGPERARPYLYAMVFIPVILIMGAWKLGLLDNLDLSWLETMPDAAALLFIALFPVTALVGMGVSFLISCHIVGKKEF